MKVYKSAKMQQAIQNTYDELLEQWGVPVTELDIETIYGITHVIISGRRRRSL